MTPTAVTVCPDVDLRTPCHPAEATAGELDPSQFVRVSRLWNRNPFVLGVGALLILWAWKLYWTWGAWGDLTIDSGREMYVPGLLAQGKMLYRDVRYIYGPAAPYFNSYLFGIFGVHLDVLYWAGSLAALGSSVLLYLTGVKLRSPLAGWAAGSVVLMQAFHPSLFCFPLAYSFASVYGCLVACAFLWLAVQAATARGWLWMFGAGSTAAVALLLKLEFGAACYGALFLLIASRAISRRSWKAVAGDLLAIAPGVLVCALVIRWMISIAGFQFLIQENMESWPSSYFMRTYGQMWLQRNGFSLTWPALGDALMRAAPVAGVVAALDSRLWRRRGARGPWLRSFLVIAVTIHLAVTAFHLSWQEGLEQCLSTLFFPQDMVLYVALAAVAAWCLTLPHLLKRKDPDLSVPLAMAFSSLLAFRMLMLMRPDNYAIYYNGPVVLCFLWLACALVPRLRASRGALLFGKSAICLGCVAVAFLCARRLEARAASFVPLATKYGTVRVTPSMAKSYQAAIQFMEDKAALGEAVLSLPEDTSLYFFSDTISPIRTYVLTPGALPPGESTERAIREIDEKRVRYLLWSNRTFIEYGAPIFGWDFNRDFGDYLRSHYQRVGALTSPVSIWEWSANVWVRKPEVLAH